MRLPRPGERLGAYQFVRELARGGMGAVFEARDTRLDRVVALKIMLLGLDQDARRFEVEAEALAKLRHPNVVQVHDAGHEAGLSYLALDLIEGESLGERLAREGQSEPREAAMLVARLARAMAHAHEQGILHRDLKPDNVMIRKEAPDQPLLTDFGLAKRLHGEKERLTQTGETLGTPGFMSPEQAEGNPDRIGPGVDVYGLGATLYALLTGQPPFVGATALGVMFAVITTPPEPPSRLRPEIDPDLERIVLRCLAKVPAERFESAAALAEALEEYLSGLQIVPQEPRVWSWLAAAGLGIAGLGIAAGLVAWSGASKAPVSVPSLELRLDAPAAAFETYAGTVEVAGHVSNPDSRVTVDGARVDVSDRGAFLHTATLRPGVNTLRVVARAKGAASAIVEREVERIGPAWFADLDAPPQLPSGLVPREEPNTYLNAADGSVLVWVPPPRGGSYERGGGDDDMGSSSPLHWVQLRRGFFLGKYEVSNAEFRRFCTAATRHPPPGSAALGYPVHSVNWIAARAYCLWADVRLPTEAEWEWAARGPEGWQYPWGPEPPTPEIASVGELSLSAPNHESKKGPLWPASQPPSSDRGQSHCGAWNMVGNVGEWTWDWWSRYRSAGRDDPMESWGPRPGDPGFAWATTHTNHRVIRGGGRHTPRLAANAVQRIGFDTKSRSQYLGFRVLRDSGSPTHVPPLRWQVQVFRMPEEKPGTWEAALEQEETFSFTVDRLRLEFGQKSPSELPQASPELRAAALDRFYFGVLATTRATFEPGRYLIEIGGDDGFRLRVDGEQRVDDWRIWELRTEEWVLEVEARREVDLRVEFHQQEGSAFLALRMWRIGDF